jgi:signal transduction histidine kinase
MADRLDAIGGSLLIESDPGRGTTVRGTVPAETSS